MAEVLPPLAHEITPAEREAEHLLEHYLGDVATLGIPVRGARVLERLIHAPPARVLDMIPVAGDADAAMAAGVTLSPPDTVDDLGTVREAGRVTHVVTPGEGLRRMSPADRDELLRLTRAHYAQPDGARVPAPALVALYEATRPDAEERQQQRELCGWSEVPTWSEWARARGEAEPVVAYGHVRLCGGWSAVLRSGVSVRDLGFPLWTVGVLEQAVAMLEAARAEADELQRKLEEERARADAAERAAAAERKKRKALETGLPDRIVLPGQMIRSGYSNEYFARLAEQLANGQTDLFVTADAPEIITAQAELQYNPSQLSDMSAAEIHAMLSVFRLFTREGDDHKRYHAHNVAVDAKLLHHAADITSRKTEDRLRLFNGLRALARRTLRIVLKVKDEQGRPVVLAKETPIVEMTVGWSLSTDQRRPLSQADADAIGRAYLETPSTEKWEGRLPDHFAFTLPPAMHTLAGQLVLTGDILGRLKKGSQSVRKAQAGLEPLDFRLFVEITQRQQRGQPSADGLRVRAFVNREKVLADHYGADQLAKWRRAGKFKERATVPYENAARALMEGGIVAHWEAQYRTADGEERDVFELAPNVVLGSERRLADPAQAALPLPEATRRRVSRRPRRKQTP